MNLKRKLLSQNFLKDPQLVSKIVGMANFGKGDTVVEIGAGRGIITAELARRCGRVVAVEIDEELVSELRSKFGQFRNVETYRADIRQFNLPTEPYKVFSNLPFHLTADIIYKLLYFSNPPREAFLVVQREAAKKFAGEPRETQFSVMAKPWFSLVVRYRFQRSDFVPEPGVEAVLLQILQREVPLVEKSDEPLFKAFVKYAFAQWKRDLGSGLAKVFTYRQWKRLAQDKGFNLKAHPSELRFDQWIGIFEFLKIGVDPARYREFS